VDIQALLQLPGSVGPLPCDSVTFSTQAEPHKVRQQIETPSVYVEVPPGCHLHYDPILPHRSYEQYRFAPETFGVGLCNFLPWNPDPAVTTVLMSQFDKAIRSHYDYGVFADSPATWKGLFKRIGKPFIYSSTSLSQPALWDMVKRSASRATSVFSWFGSEMSVLQPMVFTLTFTKTTCAHLFIVSSFCYRTLGFEGAGCDFSIVCGATWFTKISQ
jgi:hypothetical protein